MRALRGFLAASILVLATAASIPTAARTEGPDAAGYTLQDSLEVAGPAYEFDDVPWYATSLANCSDCIQGPVPIGFNFTFYGTVHDELYVAADGFLTFNGSQSSPCCGGTPIPDPGEPNELIAGYWEDLNPSTGGLIEHVTLGEAPERVFVVQFTDVPHHFDDEPVTFQFKLFEAHDAIEVHYLDAPSDGDIRHTAGIENATGEVGLQYFHGDVGVRERAVRYVAASVPGSPVVEGPDAVRRGVEVTLDVTASDPAGRDLTYHVDWGDDTGRERVTDAPLVPSGTTASASHVYEERGTMDALVQTVNDAGVVSNVTRHRIDVLNNPPGRPPAPSGPSLGTTLLDVAFEVTADDPDADPLAYRVDWGDGETDRVPAVGFAPEGENVTARHRYAAPGTYHVEVRAVDDHGGIGPLSPAATIEVIV